MIMNKMTILLERSNTLLGKFSRLFNKYPYTHIAISFDDYNFHAFSRRHLHNPFDSGYTLEKLNYYAYEDVLVKKYYLDISDKQKEDIYKLIDEVKDCPFDISGMINTNINKSKENKKAYNCMSFVARVLEVLDIKLDKKYYDNTIEDLENVLINNGYVGEEILIKKMDIDEEYMKKIPIKDVLASLYKYLRG